MVSVSPPLSTLLGSRVPLFHMLGVYPQHRDKHKLTARGQNLEVSAPIIYVRREENRSSNSKWAQKVTPAIHRTL